MGTAGFESVFSTVAIIAVVLVSVQMWRRMGPIADFGSRGALTELPGRRRERNVVKFDGCGFVACGLILIFSDPPRIGSLKPPPLPTTRINVELRKETIPSPVPSPMALFTFAALFLSFDFAVISAGLLIHAFVASNDQVKYLRAAIPQGTVLTVNRDGKVISSTSGPFRRSCLPQISQPPERFQPRSRRLSSPSSPSQRLPSCSVRELGQSSSSSSARSSHSPQFGFWPSRSPSR